MKIKAFTVVFMVFGLLQACTISRQKFTVADSVEEIPVGASVAYLSSLPRKDTDGRLQQCSYTETAINGIPATRWQIKSSSFNGLGGAKSVFLYIHTASGTPSGGCIVYHVVDDPAPDTFEVTHRPKMEKAIYALKALGVDVRYATDSGQ